MRCPKSLPIFGLGLFNAFLILFILRWFALGFLNRSTCCIRLYYQTVMVTQSCDCFSQFILICTQSRFKLMKMLLSRILRSDRPTWAYPRISPMLVNSSWGVSFLGHPIPIYHLVGYLPCKWNCLFYRSQSFEMLPLKRMAGYPDSRYTPVVFIRRSMKHRLMSSL